MRLIKAILFCLLIPVLAPACAAPASSVAARSGHVVASTRQTVGGKTVTIVSELWFTTNRCRVVTRQSDAPVETQLFDGQAMYRWTHGAKSGHTWHPAGLRVVPDIVQPLLAGTTLPGRKRAGTGTVAGTRCAVYDGTRKARAGQDWWKGTLRLRIWESLDRRFPCVLRAEGKDSAGNQIVSEVTKLSLNTPIPDHLFRPPGNVAFFPPARVRSGWRVAGGPIPMAGTVAVHLADGISNANAAKGRKSVVFEKRHYALDPQALATRSDLEEVRMETHYQNGVPKGPALALYFRAEACKRVARAAGKARGRYLVILLGGKPVSVTRITAPWIEETQRFVIAGRSGDEVSQMANYLVKVPAPRKQ
ncbi:MAG: hypothetical protein GX785_09170 [Armatimonadetes bacterium]|nr:hypothetical protein [Armatimonadota bacterium]